jgi:hypothetical protein
MILGKKYTIEEAIQHHRDFIKHDGDQYYLNPKHRYYGQVQLGMVILGLNSTDFVVFASKDNSFLNINVLRDHDLLKKFCFTLKFNYFVHMLHHVCVNKS